VTTGKPTPNLVLHTSGDGPLLRTVAQDLLLQRRELRQQGIGLRFPGLVGPRRQWQELARAMANQQQQPWEKAMRWRQRWPRHTWLCDKGFHQVLLREKALNRWRDWFDRQQLCLIVVVHLLPPRQQSWQRLMRDTLQFTGPISAGEPNHADLLYNDVYNTLIETAGVRGSRFLLHTQAHEDALPGPTAPPSGDPLDRPCWPSRHSGHEQPDLRAFALSLVLTQHLSQPLQPTERARLRRAVRKAVNQLQPVTLAQAEQLAMEAGWRPPEGAALSEHLERFALRVWGTTWPEPLPGSEPSSAAGADRPAGADLHGQRLALETTARQLLERTSMLERTSS
jgi:hypothetical protein